MANEFKVKKGLVVDGSGTVVDIQGTAGQLFSVTDSLQGDIFSVSDVSGVPILNVNSSGLVTLDGSLKLNDNNYIYLGNDNDLQIYHNGSNSFVETDTSSAGDLYIKSQGTNHDLYLQAADDIFIRPQGGENGIYVQGNGGVALYYNNSVKFETASTGIKVYGDVMPSTDGGAKLGAGSPTNLRWAGIELSNGAGIQWTNGDARIIEGLVNNYSLSFQTYDASTTTLSTALRLDGDNLATFKGNITAIVGNSHSFLLGNSNNTSSADTTGFRLHQSSYTDGRWSHRFRKYDTGGGVPLYIDGSSGTANVFTNLMRIGPYSGEVHTVEVNGSFKSTFTNTTGYQIAGTYIVDSSRNLVNINDATIGGDVDVSGNVDVNGGELKISGNFAKLFFVDTQNADEDAYIANNANGLFFGKTNSPSSANDILKLDLSTKEAILQGNLTVAGDEFKLGTGNYEKVLFDTSPSAATGNGSLFITPQTIPGSGTANFTTWFRGNGSGSGNTRHHVQIDNNLSVGGNVSVTGNLAATGTVTGSNLSGTNTGDQDLSAYITQTDADARYVLETGGTSSAMTGDLHIIAGSPKIFLQDNTDDDDQQIVFRNNGGSNEYIIGTSDFTSGGGADGFYIGSTTNDGEIGLVTANTTALTLDVSQNARFAGDVIVGSGGTGSWGELEMGTSTDAGWNASDQYPYLGSNGGSAGSLVMLHNPHVPFRTDNARSGATGRSGLRCAINTSATNWWDIGLTGDAFEIWRNASATQLMALNNIGDVTFAGAVIATGAVQVPYAAATKKPMIVLNGATSYGLFHTEASSDIFSFDFAGVSKQQFKQDGSATFAGAISAGVGTFAGAIKITETSTAQHILIGNQDSGGTNKPGMIRSANASLEFGYGNSWSGEGGAMTTSLTIHSNSNATFAGTVTATKLISTGGVLDLDDNGDADGVINARASLTLNIDSDANSTGEVFRINSNTTGVNTNNLFNITETGATSITGGTVSSGSTVLDLQGSEGQLFSVTNSLSGDLFSVSDVSGVPILNVNSSGDVDIDGDLNITDLIYHKGGGTPQSFFGFASDGDLRFSVNGFDKLHIDSQGLDVTSNLETRHILANADSTYDIGSSSVRYRNIYADTLYGDGSNLTGVGGSDNTKLPLAGGTMSGDINLGAAVNASIQKTAGGANGNFAAIEVFSSGTADTGAAIAIQQQTSEGDTIIFADYEPHVEWGISAENSANEIHFTAGNSTNNLGTKTFRNNSGTARTAYKKVIINNSNGNMFVGGSLGVSTSSASYALDVSGTIRATSDVIAFSDKRVKENIKTIDNALDKVTKLRGVSYNRKDTEDKSTKIGVIAQEIEKILPEVVETDEKGLKSVAYGNVVGVLIEAVKELTAEVEQLKKQIK